MVHITYIFRENSSRSKCLRLRKLVFSICSGFIIAKLLMVTMNKETMYKSNMHIFVVRKNFEDKSRMDTCSRMASTSFMSTKVKFKHISIASSILRMLLAWVFVSTTKQTCRQLHATARTFSKEGCNVSTIW